MRKNLHIIIAALVFSVLLWGSISLSNDYYATVNIPLKLVNFSEGYTSGTRIPENILVKLKGQGWKLLSINLGSEPEYKVSVSPDSGKQFVNLYNYLVDNQWLSSDIEIIDLKPDTLSFVVEKIITKKIKIEPNLDLTFKPGYGLASKVKFSPDSVTVYGPVSKLRSLSFIKIQEIKLESLDEKIEEILPLEEIRGVSYADKNVRLSLDIQKIVDKEFVELNVEVIDVPRDRKVLLLPNKVAVGIRGGIDIIGKLKNEDFEASVHYRDVVLDSIGSVSPFILLPKNSKLLYVKPDRLRYVIKKFN